ncbi:MAG: hypothetical protein AAF650_10340 [Pseudomonadota bacterium]
MIRTDLDRRLSDDLESWFDPSSLSSWFEVATIVLVSALAALFVTLLLFRVWPTMGTVLRVLIGGFSPLVVFVIPAFLFYFALWNAPVGGSFLATISLIITLPGPFIVAVLSGLCVSTVFCLRFDRSAVAR